MSEKHGERLIILVPTQADLVDRKYWDNFVWRVRHAVEQDGLKARVVVVEEVADADRR